MIIHCVFCNFRSNVPVIQRRQILNKLSAFSQSIDGMLSFDFGPNRDFEQKSQNYSDGFVIRFEDQQALERYAVHTQHQKLGQELCDLCENGANGIMVFDLESKQPDY